MVCKGIAVEDAAWSHDKDIVFTLYIYFYLIRFNTLRASPADPHSTCIVQKDSQKVENDELSYVSSISMTHLLIRM